MRIILIIFLFVALGAKSQEDVLERVYSTSKKLIDQEEYEQALPYLDSAILLLEHSADIEEKKMLFSCYARRSYAHYESQHLEAATQDRILAKDIRLSLSSETDSLYLINTLILGEYYGEAGNLKKARTVFKEAHDIITAHYPSAHYLAFRSLHRQFEWYWNENDSANSEKVLKEMMSRFEKTEERKISFLYWWYNIALKCIENNNDESAVRTITWMLDEGQHLFSWKDRQFWDDWEDIIEELEKLHRNELILQLSLYLDKKFSEAHFADSKESMMNLNTIGNIYFNLSNDEDRKKQISYNLREFELRKVHSGESHWRFRFVLKDIGDAYYALRQYDSSLYYYHLAEKYYKLYEEDKVYLANLYSWIGSSYSYLDQFAKASNYSELALQSIEPLKDSLPLYYLNYKSSHAWVLVNARFNSEALKVFQELEPEYHQIGSVENQINNALAIAYCLNNLSRSEDATKRYLSLLSDRELNTHFSPDTRFQIYSGLAKAYFDQSDYTNALSNYQYAQLELTNNTLLNYLGSQTVIVGLATSYLGLGNFEESEKHYLELLKLTRDHPVDYLNSLHQYSLLLRTTGRIQESIELNRNVKLNLEGLKHTQGNFYYSCLQNLAKDLTTVGQYDEAFDLYKTALDSIKVQLGESSDNYLSLIVELSRYAFEMNDFEKSTALNNEIKLILEANNRKLSSLYANCLDLEAMLHFKNGNSIAAIEHYNQLIRLTENQDGLQRAIYQTNLAIIHAQIANHEESISCLYKALDMLDEKNKFHDELRSEINNNLGIAFSNIGNPNKAITFYERSLDYLEQNQDTKSLRYAGRLTNLSTSLSDAGRVEDAKNALIKANSVKTEHLKNMLQFRSEKEKTDILTQELYATEIAQTFYLKANKEMPDLLEVLLNDQLLYKGLLLESSKDLLKELSSLGDEKILSTIDSLKILREIYSEQLTANIRSDSIVSLKKAINEMESFLTNEHHKRIGNDDLMNKDWRMVRNNLSDGEMAIEFGKFQMRMGKYANVSDSIAYVAYIIKPEFEVPKFIYLFTEEELRQLIKNESPDKLYATRGELFGTIMAERTILSDSLYDLIWSKIDPHTSAIRKIYLSPSGILNSIPFAALSNDKGEMLSERFELHMTGSIFSITKGSKSVSLKDPLLIGGIDYRFAPKEEMSALIVKTEFEKVNERLGRSKGSTWSYLPGTLEEVVGIQKVLDQKNIRSSLLKGELATEEVFEEISTNEPTVLHIATHGFYFPRTLKESNDGLTNSFVNADDPLLRSGLILAGANYAWQNGSNPYRKEDGILTALEIANMDLSTIELVVLSACETGLGESDVSDGIYGLQRAFKMAGVDRIIMSLWEVPDKETAEYMQLFYRYWIEKEDVYQAFLLAQADMRVKYRNEPHKWGAFVLFE